MGYLTVDGDEVILPGKKILGCDTEEEYKERLKDGTYRVLRTKGDLRFLREIDLLDLNTMPE